MRLVNRVTKPGNIKRVDLALDSVRIEMVDGQERWYKLVSTTDNNGSDNGDKKDQPPSNTS